MKPIFPQSSVGAAYSDDVAPMELADFLGGCSTNMPRLWRWFAADRPANPAAGLATDAARVAPSPLYLLNCPAGQACKSKPGWSRLPACRPEDGGARGNVFP